ncbi:hypothetical protein EVA_10051, partial [gut metagenome]
KKYNHEKAFIYLLSDALRRMRLVTEA